MDGQDFCHEISVISAYSVLAVPLLKLPRQECLGRVLRPTTRVQLAFPLWTAWWILQLERSSPWCWIQSSEEQLLLFAPVLWRTNCLISSWKIWCLFLPLMIIKPLPIPSDLCLGFLLKLCTAQNISEINKKNAQIHWNFFWGSKTQLHYKNIYYWFLFLLVRRL